MLVLIRDAFAPRDAEPEPFPVVAVHKASFDYADAEHVYRIHADFDPERIYSAAVAVPVK